MRHWLRLLWCSRLCHYILNPTLCCILKVSIITMMQCRQPLTCIVYFNGELEKSKQWRVEFYLYENFTQAQIILNLGWEVLQSLTHIYYYKISWLLNILETFVIVYIGLWSFKTLYSRMEEGLGLAGLTCVWERWSTTFPFPLSLSLFEFCSLYLSCPSASCWPW